MLTALDLTPPTAHERQLALESSRQLARYLRSERAVQVRVTDEQETSAPLTLPSAAVRLLVALLAEMAEGNAVTLLPLHAELTTQEAADLLNVSRPYFVRLLEEGKIPHHKIGTHRRVYAQDVLAFKRRADEESEAAMRELAEQAQELNMGY